jgi:hypothetical protein
MTSGSAPKKIGIRKNSYHSMNLRRVRPTPVRPGDTFSLVTLSLGNRRTMRYLQVHDLQVHDLLPQDPPPPSAPVAPAGASPIPEGVPLPEDMMHAQPVGEVLGPVDGLDDQRDADALAAEDMQDFAQPEVEECTDLIDDSAPPVLGSEFPDVASLLAEVRTLARGKGAADALQHK